MSLREDPTRGGAPFQFRLRSLFLLMTIAASVSALGHYLGKIVLFWFAIGVLLTSVFVLVVLGSGLVTEVLTLLIDKSIVVIGVTKRALRKPLTGRVTQMPKPTRG